MEYLHSLLVFALFEDAPLKKIENLLANRK